MPDPRYHGVPPTSPVSSTPHMAALEEGGTRFDCGTPLLLTARDGTSMPDPWPPQDVGASVNASLPES